jgi:hypothetical protein
LNSRGNLAVDLNSHAGVTIVIGDRGSLSKDQKTVYEVSPFGTRTL